MGFALSQSPLVILLVFAALAAGFAAPFVLLTLAPALLSRLPRPGDWMDTLRKALAFPMYGAAAWLVWVLAQQTDSGGLAAVLTSLVLSAFSLWLLGVFQKDGKAWVLWIALAGLALALVTAVILPRSAPVADQSGARSGETATVPYETWSPERLAALRAEGRPVLVNFTAAWCVTCQVNEKVALSTTQVAEALQSSRAVYLKADWTRRDAMIASALAEHGRAGVPLYLLYRPGVEAPTILPQLLTPGLVAEALADAAVRPPAPAAS
jgi:thiol:disulfide interchange protein DsbD